MKTKILVSYSRDDMDSWNEGRMVSFTIDTSISLSDKGVRNMARAYLDGIGCTYREFMVRTEEVTEPTSRVGKLYRVLSDDSAFPEYKPFRKGVVIRLVEDYDTTKVGTPLFTDGTGNYHHLFMDEVVLIEGD